MKGKFVVVDGLDGVGKGIFLDTFMEEAEKDKKLVFNVEDFWQEFGFHPSVSDISTYHIIVTSEPTYTTFGKFIREELISKNGRNYSTYSVAEAYALDRRILYENLLIPALEQGIDVYQSRSYSSSIVYQLQSSRDQGGGTTIQDILSIPGNAFCYKYPLDFLLIPTIENVEEVINRINNREKDDNCEFENLDFQLKLKKHYESDDFKMTFTSKGTKIVYLDAGKSLEYSKQQAREFYQNNLK